MSSSQVRPRLPTFFDLYSQGRATPDQIDDLVDQWHGGDGYEKTRPASSGGRMSDQIVLGKK